MQIWSHAFLEGATGTGAACQVSEATWTRLFQENPGARRLFARLDVADVETYCVLGSPLPASALPDGAAAATALFVPPWVLERAGLDGCGEDVAVDWFGEEAFPEATRIVLRPQDSAFYHVDAKEELERALTAAGVVAAGTVVPLALESLGGFVVSFEVVATEPAGVVLAHGDEVAIEFEEAPDYAVQAPRPPTAECQRHVGSRNVQGRSELVPTAGGINDTSALNVTPIPAEPAALVDDALLPTAVPPAGHVLGGGPVRRTADGRPWNPWREKA